jgi:hypothetical protein
LAYATRFGEPRWSTMRSRVASLINTLWTSSGQAVGKRCRYRATTPVRCAVPAEESPASVVAVSLVWAVRTRSPSAKRSTYGQARAADCGHETNGCGDP